MCGIFGAIRLSSKKRLDESIVQEGINQLEHRGPDGQGVLSLSGVCLGHSRLAIIDIDGGHQPMQTRDGKTALTYNGEVYNFTDLKQELKRKGHIFSTHSDTEVVLHAYQEWGKNCLSKFRGMFAFAAVNNTKRRALLARDRVGKKPLFYTVRDGCLFFSSELEPLYQTVGPFPLDMEGLDECLTWQYIPAPRTIYQGVFSLPPGHYIDIDLNEGSLETHPYWKLTFREDRSLDPIEWENAIEEKMHEAVRVRLVSDVPYGAFLSGGIDSSLVVGHMSELLEEPVQSFSIGFRESEYNELKYAAEVAAICHSEHHTETVEADSLGLLPTLVRHYGQPFADSSALPTYYVSRMASGKVKMVLSGDGGDENFAGYNTYESVLRGLEPGSNTTAGNLLNRFMRVIGRHTRVVPDSGGGNAMALHASIYQHFSANERNQLYRSCYKDIANDRICERQKILTDNNTPIVSRLQLLDILTYLPGDILTKVDIASMANSLEVRSPFLDHELMELAATMPVEQKLHIKEKNGDKTYGKKDILRRLALRRYPSSIVERPKWGFGLPLGNWFASNLKIEVGERLYRSEALASIFDINQIKNLVSAHSRKRDLSAKLWNLLVIDEWMKTHPAALP